eukprot:7603414-Alexandrium_andersonii.AAC.1
MGPARSSQLHIQTTHWLRLRRGLGPALHMDEAAAPEGPAVGRNVLVRASRVVRRAAPQACSVALQLRGA